MIANFILSLVASSITLALILAFWRHTRKLASYAIVLDVLFSFLAFRSFAYYFLPVFYRLFNAYSFEHDEKINLTNLTFVYLLELLGHLSWLIAVRTVTVFLTRRAMFASKERGFDSVCEANAERSAVFMLFATCGIFAVAFSMLDVAESPLVEGPLLFFGPFFAALGMSLGPYMLLARHRRWPIPLRTAGATITALTVALFSTRGVLVYTMLWSGFIAFHVARFKLTKTVAILFLAGTTALFLFAGGLPRLELGKGNQIGDRVEFSSRIDTDKRGERSPLQEIAWRFGAATRMSTAFIDMYNRGDGAGFAPIRNSLFGFMPRYFWPDKPHPSTLYGDDYYSQGMFLIYRETYSYNTYSMCEFSTAAHAYWEFGIAGVLILSAVSGIYAASCAYFFSKMGAIAIPVIVIILKPWGYTDPKIWVSDIILQIYTLILPLIALWLTIKWIVPSRGGIPSWMQATRRHSFKSETF